MRPKIIASSSVVSKKKVWIEVLSVVALCIGLFILVSLWTYHANDPSIFNNSRDLAKNACGRLGAYVSSILLLSIGLGSYLIPVSSFLVAANIYRSNQITKLIGMIGGICIAVLAFTVFLSVQSKYWPYAGGLILTGGTFGVWVTEALLLPLNTFGASLVSLLVFVLAVVIATPVSVAQSVGKVLEALNRAFFLLLRSGLKGGWVGSKKVATWSALGLKSGVSQAQDWISEKIENQKTKAANRTAAKSEIALGAVSAEPVAENEPAIQESEWKELEPESLDETETDSDEEPTEDSSIEITERVASEEASVAPKRKVGGWKLPTMEFLKQAPKVDSKIDRDKLMENSEILKKKLLDFGIEGDIIAVRPGPVITLYEFRPGPGIKVSRIAALADDLSMALSAENIRILAPLPGKSVCGIEIPNDQREMVYLREFLQHPDFYGSKYTLPVAMGKDISGAPMISDLSKMPHLLVSGQTGSGKSVFMNSLICSLLYRFTPNELRMILVDPKFIEFRAYQDIPHLYLPVVDDAKNASIALKWAVREMERRYRILAMLGVRNLASYNQKVEEMGADVVRDVLISEDQDAPKSTQLGGSSASGADWMDAYETDDHGAPQIGKLPYVVIIIDELADLMMIARKDVEISIARIAQKARASGIHLVLATQRPSTDVITGLIKANLPSRVSFQLSSHIDSKTILDRAGAERLLGSGDMLFIPPGSFQLKRLHGTLVEDSEIDKITSYLRSQGEPIYREEILVDDDEDGEGMGDSSEDADPLFAEALQLVKQSGHASASFIQRHLKVGYNRAARMIEHMEEKGFVGPAEGARPREVFVDRIGL